MNLEEKSDANLAKFLDHLKVSIKISEEMFFIDPLDFENREQLLINLIASHSSKITNPKEVF